MRTGIRRPKLYIVLLVLAGYFFVGLTARADTVGQQVNFNVNSKFDKYGRDSISATLRHISEKAYFYIDDSYWSGLDSVKMNSLISNISSLAGYFDKTIYPKEVSFFGSEPNPGVDGDTRITILIEDLIKNNGGYFDTANGYSKSQISDSNAREMIAMNAEITLLDVLISKMFLAHEFQHLISYNQKEKTYNLSEDVWLNELRSEYAVSHVGLNDNYEESSLRRRVHVFNGNYYDSLTEWPNENIDYGVAALFAEYIIEQFGGEILSETIKYPLTGMSSLNQYLQRHNERFGDVFLNWLGALYLNDVSRSAKFGYRRPDLMSLRVTPQQRIFLSSGLPEYSGTQYLKDWQPVWLEFDVGALSGDFTKSFKIDLTGAQGQSFIASYIAVSDIGSVESGKINIIGGQGSGLILNSSGRKLQKVVVMATKNTKTSGFGENEVPASLNVKISMIDSEKARASVLGDGALIKRPREKEMYVIWGKYKRYLGPEIIALYGHLNPANAIELDPVTFDSYITSNYVKYVNDQKVYAIWPDGTKHWLNITPRQWEDSHRDWNAIFTISDLELNHYRDGARITH